METIKPKIKAVIFDIGGILHKEVLYNTFSGLYKIFNLNKKKLDKARNKYYKSAQIGKLSAFEYPKFVAKDLKIKDIKKFIATLDKFRNKEIVINKDVEKTILKLKKNYIIGTLTNVTKTSDRIRVKKNVYKYFKLKLISHKIGLRKPNKKIYKLLIKRLKLLPSEIIFIDNEKEYLKPAKKLGMKTILFKNNKQLVSDLKKLGVRI